MGKNFELTEFNILDVIDEIRKPNGHKHKNDRTFAWIVPDVWDKLGLEGESSQILLERLLINLILTMYDAGQTTSNEEKRNKAKQRDFSLLMFGLLDKYRHTEVENGRTVNIPSEKRYEKYLNDGHFIRLDYPGEGSYQEIKAREKITRPGRQNRPLNALTRAISDCKKEIGAELFKVIQDNSYKNYMAITENGKIAGTEVTFPQLYYTKDNFEPKKVDLESYADSKDSLTGDEECVQGKIKHSAPVIEDAFTYKSPESDKADISAKVKSTAVAGAGSNVSIHIINVVGERGESNKDALIQDKGGKAGEKLLRDSKNPECLSEPSDGDKSQKRNKGIPKKIIVVATIILAVLLIIIIVVPKMFKGNPATSDSPPQSGQDWLRMQMETMNREIPGGIVNSASATIEVTVTVPATGEIYTYTKTISVEQNTGELEEPVHESID